MVVVAAIDRSERASQVVEEGAKLARLLDESIHVVYVLTDSKYYNLQRTNVEKKGTGVEMEEVERVASEIAGEAVDELEVAWEPVGLVGDPSKRIVDYAADVDAEYVVIGPKKRSPSGKALFGSVAQSVLLNSPSPVVSTSTV